MHDNRLPKDRLITRWGALKSERASWLSHWKEISEVTLPRNGRFFVQDRNRGMKRNRRIYDNTPTRALKVLAAGLMSGMTSPARPWFRLQTQDPDLNQNANVKTWLDDCTKLLLQIFQRSNTYRALHSVYLELGLFGTAATIVVPDYENVIHHTPLTAGEYCIATDWKGNVSTLFREFERTVHEIVNEFGIDNVSTTVRQQFNGGSLDVWVPIVHCIEPRADRDYGNPGNRNMPWRSVYFELGGGNQNFLRESGFKTFPALCPRWDVIGGDIYGNGPGMDALGDINQLQQEQLRKSQGIDFMTNPPLQVPSSMKNRDVETLPGGISYVDMNSPGSAIKSAFEVQLDLNHLLADIQDVRERINGAFYADLFLMLANDQNQRMTATEVAERHEEKMLMLGPVLERLQNELLEPLIDFTFDQVMDNNLAPPPPQELEGQDLHVELVSILAQAQKAIQTNAIDRFMGNVGALAQVKPEVLDNIDADAWAHVYSDALGIDPSLILPDEEVAKIRAQRAQQQAAAQQAAMAEQQANTAQTLSNTPTGGDTALAGIMGGLTGYG